VYSLLQKFRNGILDEFSQGHFGILFNKAMEQRIKRPELWTFFRGRMDEGINDGIPLTLAEECDFLLCHMISQ